MPCSARPCLPGVCRSPNAGIRESILTALAKCPLYDEEITNVVEFVLAETQDIKDEAIGDYWTADQFENLSHALTDVAARPSPPPPDEARQEPATAKYRDFERMQEQVKLASAASFGATSSRDHQACPRDPA